MMKTRELSLLPPICTRLKHSKSHENYLGFSRIIVNSIYLVCRREGRRKCLWHRLCFSFRLSRCSLLRQFFPPPTQNPSETGKFSCNKNKYRVIIRFIKLAHHSTADGSYSYLWLLVKDSMVCVVGLQGTLLNVSMMEQKVLFETANL